MRNHKSLWLSSCGGNLTSWQHTKFVGWKGGGAPIPPFILINSPNTIGDYNSPEQPGYGDFFIDNPYGGDYQVPLKNKTVDNNGKDVVYYILDSDGIGGNQAYGFFDYSDKLIHRSLSVTPQGTEIRTTNGNVNIDDIHADILIITAVGFISDFIENQEDDLIPDSEILEYLDYLRIPINYNDIHETKFNDTSDSTTYINGYYYKVTESTWTNHIFAGAKVQGLVNTKSLYSGYDYSLNEYKYPSDKVIKWAHGIPTSTILALQYQYNPPEANYYYGAPGISGGWSMYPSNYVNYPYVIPDLPIMGGQHPYEYQWVHCEKTKSNHHRWEHCISRYWFIPHN